MAKKQIGQPQREYFCKDCKLHFGEYSHPVVNGKYDTSRNILCRCPYSENSKLLTTKDYKMNRIKCATFDKEMQDSIPKEIREKMKADREKAEKEQESNAKNLPIQNVMGSVSKDFIHNDISRCNNYKCPTNFCCARFRQIQVDRKKEGRHIYSTTAFNGHEKNGLCDYFLNVDCSPHCP